MCNNNNASSWNEEALDSGNEEEVEASVTTYSYYRYGTMAAIQSEYTARKPLSVVSYQIISLVAVHQQQE